MEVEYLRAIVFDLQCRQVEPNVDNTATLAVANGNHFKHETVKHVTVKVRLLQGCVQCKLALLAPISMHQNIDDVLTSKQSAQTLLDLSSVCTGTTFLA